MNEVNICCPYFRTVKCSDTKEHRHLICKSSGELITNNDALYKCISDGKFVVCGNYNQPCQTS